MKKFIVGVLCFSFLMNPAWAQDDEEKEHYKTKLLVQAIPIYFDLSSTQSFGMGYGFQVDGFIQKRFSYTAGFGTNGYSDTNKESAENKLSSNARQSMKTGGFYQANFRFHLIDKMAKGKAVREEMGYPFVKVYKAKGVMVRKILAVRGGYYHSNGVAMPEKEGWNLLPTGSSTPVLATEKDFTNYSASSMTAGLSMGKLVSTDVGGRHTSYYRVWFADAMFKASAKLDDLKTDATTFKFQTSEGNLTNQPIGWRAGWEYIALGRKHIIASCRIEFGNRSGINTLGKFYQISFGLGIKYAPQSGEK